MNRLPQPLIDRLQELRRSGMSIRQVADATDTSTHTVVLYTKGLPRADCACGKPGGHRGWCHVMLARSPARRALLATFTPHNKKWTDEARAAVHADFSSGVRLEEIANKINQMLGRHDISPSAVEMQAYKLGAKRPLWAKSLNSQTGALRRWHGSNKEKWRAALRRKLAKDGRQLRRQRPYSVDREAARRAWGDPTLGWRAVQVATGMTYQCLRNWFGPRAQAIVTPVISEKAPDNQDIMRRAPQFLPMPLPAAADVPAPKRRGFSMSAMRGPDPRTEVWLRQKAEASKGVLNPVMRGPF